jgi:hypothetical protein
VPRRTDRSPRRAGPNSDALIEYRRNLVWQLKRVQYLTDAAIVRALAELEDPIVVSEETVRRDVAWWVEHGRSQFDPDTFDPRDAIAEACRTFDFVKSRAARTMITPGTDEKIRLIAGRTILAAEKLKIELLAGTGLVRTPHSTGPRTSISASDVRALLAQANDAQAVIEGELVPPGDRRGVGELAP